MPLNCYKFQLKADELKDTKFCFSIYIMAQDIKFECFENKMWFILNFKSKRI